MRRLIIAAVLLATAAPTIAAPTIQEENRWASQPSGEDWEAVLPADVVAAGGRVLLRCKPGAEGALTDCAVAAEAPSGRGVGRAALSLVPKYRLTPEAEKAAVADGQVMIRKAWFDADTPPDWRRRPTVDQLRAVWPAEAWAQRRNGSALINCLVSTAGALYDCAVLSESPAGAGFGAAAISLTPQFLMWPAQLDGHAAVSDIQVPVSFKGAEGSYAFVETRRVIPPAISWSAAPSVADVLAAYPAKARAAKLKGFASVQCNLQRDGGLGECKILQEAPKGSGFGAAAKTLAGRFRLDRSLLPPDTGRLNVNLPVIFDVDALQNGAGGKTVWTRTPDFEVLKGAFTHLKPTANSGRAVLSCKVAQGGGLEACAVASEQPAGSGLGDTALALQESFGVATWSGAGLPVVGRTILVPVRFDFTEPAPAESPAQP